MTEYHDMISISMLKLYGKSICESFDVIFQSCIKQEEFATEWKKNKYLSCPLKKVASRL